jgi:hypothetical protein
LSFVSAKLSSDGNMYLTNFNQPNSIFHTVSLSLPPFSVNIETPVPIVLPCFNPCQNLILGPKLRRKRQAKQGRKPPPKVRPKARRS